MSKQYEHEQAGNGSRQSLWRWALVGVVVVAICGVAAAGRHFTVGENRIIWISPLVVVLVVWFVCLMLMDTKASRGERAARLGIFVLTAVIAVGGYAYAAHTSPELPPCPQEQAYTEFGDPTRVGGLEYVLTGVERDTPRSAARAAEVRPLGEWFVVHGTVTNVFAAPGRFSSQASRLRICDVRYAPDEALSTEERILNPGLTAAFVMVFDVPKGFPDGEGVVVRLRGPDDSGYVRWDG